MDADILERINRSALRFLEPLTPESTYTTIIEEALKLVSGDEGYIALGKKEELSIVSAYPQTLMSLKMRKRGFSYKAFSKRKAFVTYLEDYKDIHPELVEAGIQSTIFIPISYRNQSIGVMNIMSRRRSKRFSEKELSVLKLFGSLASLAIRKTQLYNETKLALEMRDLFLSMAAHEFRTPVTTIGGYAQMLKLKIKQEVVEKRWVEEIYREAQRLTRLVNELLEVNRMRTGQLQYHWQECNLYKLINEAVELFKISHPEREISFREEIGEEPDIIGDYDKLMQVMTNILDNAAKFSAINQHVILLLKKNNGELILKIRDFGRGMIEKDQDKVFEGYYRGSGNTKEGMGLGLYISRQIIEEHKGKIKIKSKLNKGTTVEIRFPRRSIFNHITKASD